MNKETLQKNNTTINVNNNELASILETINNLPESGGEAPVEPNYIQDGLIAWFDGEDELNENGQLVNKIGSDGDYIAPCISNVRTVKLNPLSKPYGSKAITNNMMYSLRTSKDYYNTGYTYEVVGLIKNDYNDTENINDYEVKTIVKQDNYYYKCFKVIVEVNKNSQIRRLESYVLQQ